MSRAKRTEGTGQATRSRRSGRRPVDVTLALAVALPLLVALALFLTNPGFGTAYFHLPTTPALSRATVVCPSSIGSGDQIGIGSAGSGEVTLAPLAQGNSTLPLVEATVPADGADVGTAAGTGPVVVTASGAAAPGLGGTRSATEPVAAATCVSPRSDQWFTGVGAGPTHDSYVELVNPNPGQAVADITVLGDTGPIDVPALRGIAVPGHASKEIDLGAVMPTQGALALHAVVERGQVAVAVRDRAAHLVGDAYDEDWLPAQTKPARRALLLGITAGSGSRQLSVANPSNREITATVRLVSANSIFTPDNAPTLDVGPQSVAKVDLGKVLDSAAAGGTVGVQVVANGAVTAALRSVVGGDVSVIARSQRTKAATSVVVPSGAKKLVVGAANKVGALTVVARNAAGKELSSQRVAIVPRQGLTVALPDNAVRVDVTPERTAFRGVIVLSRDGGTAVVPLPRLKVTSRVPYVKPGLPR
jgi:hypothetical protein